MRNKLKILAPRIGQSPCLRKSWNLCAESVLVISYAVWGDIMSVDNGMDRESGVSMKRGCDSEIVYTKGIADLMEECEKGDWGTCNAHQDINRVLLLVCGVL